jgi:hypothetical protein
VKYIKIKAMAIIAAGALAFFAGQALAQFPVVPEDHVRSSLGSFRIAVLPQWDPIMTGYPGYTPPGLDPYGRLDSPVLFDPATVIGVSGVHNDGGLIDMSGTPVGTAGTMVSDAMLILRPPGFEGPPGTRELHTEVYSLQMDNFGAPPTVRAGPGAIPPVFTTSPGEIESHNVAGDFPAESFFDVYVEVDLPPGGLMFPGAVLHNPTPTLVNQDSLYYLPPKVIYIHEKSSAVPVRFLYADPGGLWMAGDLYGFLVLAGHGFDMTPADIGYFEEVMWQQDEMPIPQGIVCPWPEEEGYDTIPYSVYEIEVYDADDPELLLDVVQAEGHTIVLRHPYESESGQMPIEIIELIGVGYCEILGGEIEVSLDHSLPSTGIIEPCDTTCEYASSQLTVNYQVMAPVGTIYGSGQMGLVEGCFPEPTIGWIPMDGNVFQPPLDRVYEDPRKVPVYLNEGLIGYVWLRHWLYRKFCDCRPGDANGDGEVNIGDAVYLIAYVFKGGPPPVPYALCSGDANCDCELNVGDAVYIIAYVFKGGPPPCTCEEWLAKCGPPLRK